MSLSISSCFQETGLIRLLRREIAAVFRDNRMIAVCQNVALGAEDKLAIRHQLRKHKILMKVFPNEVAVTLSQDPSLPPLPLHACQTEVGSVPSIACF